MPCCLVFVMWSKDIVLHFFIIIWLKPSEKKLYFGLLWSTMCVAGHYFNNSLDGPFTARQRASTVGLVPHEMYVIAKCISAQVCMCAWGWGGWSAETVGRRQDIWLLSQHLWACEHFICACPAQLCPPIRCLVRPLVRAVTEHQQGPCRCLMHGVCQACVPAWW